jgi:triacylglycerol lipase
MRAVLLVHGIWNTGKDFASLRRALEAAGAAAVEAVDLDPNSGAASIEALARQVAEAADRLRQRSAEDRVDVVGFSMGALVTRYWIQRLGGAERVRRFISIAGPQQGTWLAHLSPLSGVREMRPGSATLRSLADSESWQEVELHC